MPDENVPSTHASSKNPKWLSWLNIISAVISIVGFPLGFFFWMIPADEKVPWMVIATVLLGMSGVLLAVSACLRFYFETQYHKKVAEDERRKNRENEDARQTMQQAREHAVEVERKLLDEQWTKEKEELSTKIADLSTQFLQELDSRQKNRCKHLEAFHKQLHDIRDISHGSLMVKEPLNEDEIANLFEKMVVSVLDNTTDLFRAYFQSTGRDVGDDVAAALKLRVPREELGRYLKNFSPERTSQLLGTETEALITFARDQNTRRRFPEREVRGRPYSMKANTAFEQILTEGTMAFKRACFANDNLKEAYKDAMYRNQNPVWSENYNATIAVAVRFHAPGLLPYGFLCIDSRNDKNLTLYKGDEVYHIASHAADLLAVLILGVTLFKDWAGARNKKRENRRTKQD